MAISWLSGYKYRLLYTMEAPIPVQSCAFCDAGWYINISRFTTIIDMAEKYSLDPTNCMMAQIDGTTKISSKNVIQRQKNYLTWTFNLDGPTPEEAAAIEASYQNTLSADLATDWPEWLVNANGANGVGQFYLYYGRTSAEPYDPYTPASWTTFDHFTGVALDTDMWEVVQTDSDDTIEVVDSKLNLQSSGSSSLIIKSVEEFEKGTILEVSMQFNSSLAIVGRTKIGFSIVDTSYFGIIYVYSESGTVYWRSWTYSAEGSQFTTFDNIYAPNQLVKLRIEYGVSGEIDYYIDDALLSNGVLGSGDVRVMFDGTSGIVGGTSALTLIDYIGINEVPGLDLDPDGDPDNPAVGGEEEMTKIGARTLESAKSVTPWVIEQGSIFHEQYVWRDANGDTYDLSDYSAKCEIRKTTSGAVLATPTITLGGSLGIISIDLTSVQTRALTFSRAALHVEVSPSGGDTHTAADVIRILSGPITLTKEIVQ